MKFAGQFQDSFLELLLLLLLGAEIPRQEGKADSLGRSPDEGGVEFMRAGLLQVGEMQEMGDIVAVFQGFAAGEAVVLAARPGDDGVFIIRSIWQNGFAFWARGPSIIRLGELRLKEVSAFIIPRT